MLCAWNEKDIKTMTRAPLYVLYHHHHACEKWSETHIYKKESLMRVLRLKTRAYSTRMYASSFISIAQRAKAPMSIRVQIIYAGAMIFSQMYALITHRDSVVVYREERYHAKQKNKSAIMRIVASSMFLPRENITHPSINTHAQCSSRYGERKSQRRERYIEVLDSRVCFIP